jgi:hypothetical protein
MRPVSTSISIDVPRERVFDLICDLSTRPAFTDHMLTQYRLERVDPVGVGASARFRLGESGAWLDTAIESAERPHTIREQGSGGRFNRLPVFSAWELAEGPGPGGCEVTVTFWTEPQHIVDKLRNPLWRPGRLKRGWARALRRLRDLAESGQPLERVAVAGEDRLPTFVS